MSHVRKIAVIAAMSAALFACGRGGGLASGSTGFTLKIQTAGGFLPAGADLAAMPEFTLTSDGRIVTEGPQIQIYPGPALPNALQRTITEAGVKAILDEARKAGLLGPDKHYDYEGVADAGTTFFISTLDGERHQISAYALGGFEGGPGDAKADKPARDALQKFREKLGDLASWLPEGSLGEEEPMAISSLRTVVRGAAPAGEGDVKPDRKDWPLATPLATFGEGEGEIRCGIVTGDDLSKLLPEARKATQITEWSSEGKNHNLAFRPQLPDETGCEVPSRS